MRPKIGAASVRGERQIVIEADGQSFVARVLLRPLELHVHLPLQVLIKHNRSPVFFLELARSGRLWIAIRRGPLGPDPYFEAPFMDPLIQRAISCEARQQVTLARHVFPELLSARGA